MSLFGFSAKSSSSSSTVNQDQRQVASEYGVNAAAGSNVNIAGVNQELLAQMYGAVAEGQVDSIKAIVGLGEKAFEGAADIFNKSSANAAQAWAGTLATGKELVQSPDKTTNETLKTLGIAGAVAVAVAFIFR